MYCKGAPLKAHGDICMLCVYPPDCVKLQRVLRLDWHLVYDSLTLRIAIIPAHIVRTKYKTKRCREVPLRVKQVPHPRADHNQGVKVAKDLPAYALSVTQKWYCAPCCAVLYLAKEPTKGASCLIRVKRIALEAFKEKHSSLSEPSRLTVV